MYSSTFGGRDSGRRVFKYATASIKVNESTTMEPRSEISTQVRCKMSRWRRRSRHDEKESLRRYASENADIPQVLLRFLAARVG
jgi:hypothetical protein